MSMNTSSKLTKKIILAVVIFLLVMFIAMLSKCSNDRNANKALTKNSQQKTPTNTENTVDNVDYPNANETLKTVFSKELGNASALESIKSSQEQSQNHLKQSIVQLQKNQEAFQAQMKQGLLSEQNNLASEQKTKHSATKNKSEGYDIGGQASASQGVIWVSDMQKTTLHLSSGNTQAGLNNLKSKQKSNASLLLGGTSEGLAKVKPIPYYTFPISSTLTGATLLQPLRARTPIDGQVPNAYYFKVALGRKNLATNGVEVPPAVKGAVASGWAEGDMLSSCARGYITTITFTFQDGTISTTTAKGSGNLGTISTASGDPCIHGTFHSNAALVLGVGGLFKGGEAWGNAIAQAATNSTFYSNPSTGGSPSVYQTIKNADQYGLGRFSAGFSSNANHWWQQRVKSSYDYVYVPNFNPITHQFLKLNINLTQQVDINYNPNGRKVFYEHKKTPFVNADFD